MKKEIPSGHKISLNENIKQLHELQKDDTDQINTWVVKNRDVYGITLTKCITF